MLKEPHQTVRVMTWNINGWRAASQRGLLQWLERERPEIVCLQETRLDARQVEAFQPSASGYHGFFVGGRAGYSGTAILARAAPLAVVATGVPTLDAEGRTMVAEFGDLFVVNAYVPNGNRNPDRLAFKHLYLKALFAYTTRLGQSSKPVILCGDFNTAHTSLDLAHPAARMTTRSGFLPSERALVDAFLENGWCDSFRVTHPEDCGSFTWWAAHANARERNLGWRFDYVFLPEKLRDRVESTHMYAQVRISDHCPFMVSLLRCQQPRSRATGRNAGAYSTKTLATHPFTSSLDGFVGASSGRRKPVRASGLTARVQPGS